MRRFLLLVLGSAILISACGSSKVATAPAASTTPIASSAVDGDWTTFGPAGAGFSTKYPAAPTLTTSTTATAVGDAPTSVWTDKEGGNLIYAVLVANYPAGSLPAAKVSQVYDGAVNGMTGGTAGLTLSSQGNTTLNGHLGRSYLLTSAVGSLQGVVFIVGDTMYMAYVAYTSSLDPALIATFLADFQLTV